MIRARLVVLALALVALVVSCGPAHPGGSPVVLGEPITDEARTALGNRVLFGASLSDHPDWRAETVALIDSEEAANPSPNYFPITFYVFADAIRFSSPTGTPFGNVVTSVESCYLPESSSVFFSWTLAGPIGDSSQEYFAVGNVPYELANVRCQCESALRSNP